MSRKFWLVSTGVVGSPVVAIAALLAASAGTVIGGSPSVSYDATHWGILPAPALPMRSHEIVVRRWIDGQEVPLCVSKERYDRAAIGDWYLGGY